MELLKMYLFYSFYILSVVQYNLIMGDIHFIYMLYVQYVPKLYQFSEDDNIMC